MTAQMTYAASRISVHLENGIPHEYRAMFKGNNIINFKRREKKKKKSEKAETANK